MLSPEDTEDLKVLGASYSVVDVLLSDYRRSQAALAAALKERDEARTALKSCLPFDKKGADRLADEVAVLVRRRVIDARSPAGDALLDYREPPSTPRADRLAELEKERERLSKLAADLHSGLLPSNPGVRINCEHCAGSGHAAPPAAKPEGGG